MNSIEISRDSGEATETCVPSILQLIVELSAENTATEECLNLVYELL